MRPHVFAAHFVECSDHSTLNDRPETLDGLSMNHANDVLAMDMVNGGVWIFFVEMFVADPLISAEQANFMRHSFTDKRSQCGRSDVINNPCDNIALALYCSNNRRFAGPDTAASAVALVPMLVFVFAADEAFIDLDNATELLDVFDKGNSDLVAHHPSGFVGTEPHVAHNLECTYPFFASQHQMNNAIPVAQWLIGILKNGVHQYREAVASRTAGGALGALPMPFARWQIIYRRVAATRAADAFRPTARNKLSLACIFVRKHLLKLTNGQLVNRFWLFCTSHSCALLSIKGAYHG